MSAPDPPSGSRQDPLDAVIADYLQQVEAGALRGAGPSRLRPAARQAGNLKRGGERLGEGYS